MVETARILGGTYIPAGARQFADGSPAAPAPAAPITVSLAGAQMTLLVDGRPMRAIVDERIVRAFPTDVQVRSEFGR